MVEHLDDKIRNGQRVLSYKLCGGKGAPLAMWRRVGAQNINVRVATSCWACDCSLATMKWTGIDLYP